MKILIAILFLLNFTKVFAEAQKKEVVFSIFPRTYPKATFKKFNPILKHLETKLGITTKLVMHKDFPEFMESLKSNNYDIVHYNQYQYLIGHKKFGHQLLLVNEENGESRVGGAIVVRKDSGIKKVEDLKGKKIIFGGGKSAMMAYIYPKYILKKHGLEEKDYKEEIAKNPLAAYSAMYFKQYDAAGAGDLVTSLEGVTENIDTNQTMFIGTMPKIPFINWAYTKKLDPKLAQAIKQELLKLKETEEGKALLKNASMTAFVEVTDDEYDPARKIIKELYGEDY